jgi:hypothetical protein
MTKPQRNVRTLDSIAADIHRLEQGNIIDIGDLLVEAKAKECEHGGWLSWLWSEFEWSEDTAARYMRVAELAAKFRSVRNLKLARVTLYELVAKHKNHEDIPAIIAELEKHATKTRLRPDDARRVIDISIGRRRFGDLPEATLHQLVRLDSFPSYRNAPWYQQAIAALQERRPETDEEAQAIIEEVIADEAAQDDSAEDKAEDDEIEAILDGPPPDLTPPITPPEPQKLTGGTVWAGQGEFDGAISVLLAWSSKPAARFVGGMYSPEKLREVSDFVSAVARDKAKAQEKATA